MIKLYAAPAQYRFALAFIGEDNPHSADPRYALYHEPQNCAGDRLRRLICRVRVTTYHRIGRSNLCAGRWSAAEAAQNAATLRDAAPDLRLVLFGAKVAGAFSLPTDPFCAHGRFLVLPHPSGRNRVWNTAGAFDRAHQALRDFAPEIPWGDDAPQHKE